MKPLLTLFILFTLTACKAQKNSYLADTNATKLTQSLHNNMIEIANKHILLGHQDALAYGVNWRYEEGRSDIHDVTGEYPAIMGWDIGKIEHRAQKNLDGVPFDKMRQYIIESAKRGSINTISWHLDNPLSNRDSWDTTIVVKHILPNGHLHQKYKSWLDEVANFIQSLKFENGEPVPILFRPFHELNGNWFWWGKKHCSTEEYIDLWKFTFYYLKDIKNINQLIYVYNTNSFASEEEFLERYPGDDYVDILSFDTYQFDNNITVEKSSAKFKNHLQNNLAILEKVGKMKNKLIAIGEIGYETIPQNDWWTDILFESIKNINLSYFLLWRNQGLLNNKMHYYAPYKGHKSAENFNRMLETDRIILQKKLEKLHLYNK